MIEFKTIKDVEEIEVLREIESTYGDFKYSYSNNTINLLKENLQLPDSLYIIARKDKEFVGFFSCDTDWWEEKSFFIREIFVNPVFQKKQVGEKLVRMGIQHAKKHGAVQIVTQTAFENIPMQKLCQKLGFVVWENPQWKQGITYKLFLN